MKSVTRPLSETLTIPVQYYIPVFQRHYNWKREHWKKLWEHLTTYLPERIATRSTAKHFLGPIVGFSDAHDRWVVIDGQQRLTTLFLLLIAIRDLATKCEESDAILTAWEPSSDGVVPLSVQIDRSYLRTVKGESKLKPRESPADREKDDSRIFNALLRRVRDPKDKDSYLCKAYDFFSKSLLDLKGNGTRLQKLTQLTSRILDHLNLVEITLDLDDDSYVVFDTLNSAGLKISEGDCLRNYFYMKLDLTKHEELRKCWGPIETDLRNLGTKHKDYLTSFCHDYLMMVAKEYFGKEHVYLRAQGHLESAGPQGVIDFADEMYKASRLYLRLIRHGERISLETDLDVREALRGLLSLEVEAYLPYLLYLYLEYENGRLPKERILRILSLLENYTMRNGLADLRTSGSQRDLKLFPQLCLPLTEEELKVKLLKNSRYPTDGEVRNKIKTANLYASRAKKYNFLIRQRLEQGPEQPDFSKAQLDHILPQDKNNPAWGKYLGDEYPRVYKTYLHTLGNQVLLGSEYNRACSTKLFEEKREQYQKSIFKWTRRVGQFDKWGEEEILTYVEELTAALLEIWPDLDSKNELRWNNNPVVEAPLDVMQLLHDLG